MSAAPPDHAEGLSTGESAPSLHSLMSLAFPDGVHPQHASAPVPHGFADFDPSRHMTPEPARPAPSPTRARAMSDSWAHSSYMHSFQQSPTVSHAPPAPHAPIASHSQYPPRFQPPASFNHEQNAPDYGLPPPMPPMVVGPQNSPQGPPVRLFQTAHRVSMARYATSSDPRGYIPVLEYSIGPHHIMIDSETGAGPSLRAHDTDGSVHFTGIWKALGHAKADVNRLIESDTSIAPLVRKIRGGFFGPTFGDPGYGSLVLSAPKSRARSRAASRPPLEPSSDGGTGPIRTQQSWERFRPKWSRPPPQGTSPSLVPADASGEVAAPYLREGAEPGYDAQPYVHRPPSPPQQQPQPHHLYSELPAHGFGFNGDPAMFGLALYPPEQSFGVGRPGSTPIQLAPLQGNILPPHLQHSAQTAGLRSGEMPPDPPTQHFDWSMPGDPAAQALLQMSINTPTTSWTPATSAQMGRHAEPAQLPTLESLVAMHSGQPGQPSSAAQAQPPPPRQAGDPATVPSSDIEPQRGQIKLFSPSAMRTPPGQRSPRAQELTSSTPLRSSVFAPDQAPSSSPGPSTVTSAA